MAGRADERSRTHGALASASRVRILDLLRDSYTPPDVLQIAEQSGLHHNTVRFHLKILVDAGLACCRTDPRRGASGRPRLLYTASTDHSDTMHQHGYQLLADILTSYLAANSTITTEGPRKPVARSPTATGGRRHHSPKSPATRLCVK
jgi:predicted ArsR family transcriptional regulator